MKEIPIEKLARVVGGEIDETTRAIKIAIFNGVIRDTRVDTGRLRSNWQITTGQPASGELDRVNESEALQEVAQNVTPDKVDFLSNNLPYAEVWEERDGMIATNVARIDRIIAEKIRDQN